MIMYIFYLEGGDLHIPHVSHKGKYMASISFWIRIRWTQQIVMVHIDSFGNKKEGDTQKFA